LIFSEDRELVLIEMDISVAKDAFPTTLVVAAAVVITAVICAGLLLYFTKFRKRRAA
jgi:hypothetical protein